MGIVNPARASTSQTEGTGQQTDANALTTLLNEFNGNITGPNVNAAAALSIASLITSGNATVGGNLTVTGTVNGRRISASPYFRAYRSAAVSYTTGSVVVFDTDDSDPNNWYDVATGKFQPTVAGRYRVSWLVTANGPLTADKQWAGILQKNGSDAAYGMLAWQRSTTLGIRSLGTALVAANGTSDYFQVLVAHDVGSATALLTGSHLVYFEGEYVGA